MDEELCGGERSVPLTLTFHLHECSFSALSSVSAGLPITVRGGRVIETQPVIDSCGGCLAEHHAGSLRENLGEVRL